MDQNFKIRAGAVNYKQVNTVELLLFNSHLTYVVAVMLLLLCCYCYGVPDGGVSHLSFWLKQGGAIEKLCEEVEDDNQSDRAALVRAARCLLGAVTRVLLLADIVVVKQLLLAKDKVQRSLGRLESVNNFTEFVKAFSQFGAEMVELAHLTGDRQNDLKDERRRAQMAAARQVLERSTMMLLTSSKVIIY